MKKFIVILALVFAFTGIVSAHELNDTNGTPIDHAHGNGDPNLVINGWGLNNYQSKIVKGGTIINDGMGITEKCPVWQPVCVDLTQTAYYRNAMIFTAKQHWATGQTSRFPMFKKWHDSVK